eukprot:COSAG05_NODE_5751_length_1098_cov_0.976977_1_plen_215_part_00
MASSTDSRARIDNVGVSQSCMASSTDSRARIDNVGVSQSCMVMPTGGWARIVTVGISQSCMVMSTGGWARIVTVGISQSCMVMSTGGWSRIVTVGISQSCMVALGRSALTNGRIASAFDFVGSKNVDPSDHEHWDLLFGTTLSSKWSAVLKLTARTIHGGPINQVEALNMRTAAAGHLQRNAEKAQKAAGDLVKSMMSGGRACQPRRQQGAGGE